MKNIHINKIIYRLRHEYLQLNNVVVIVALIVAASWTWSAVSVMQRNYTLEREIESKKQQSQLLKLQDDTLAYQSQYYKSPEYLQLQARDLLGLASPGEHVLVLPPNSKAAKQEDAKSAEQQVVATVRPSNFEQWMNFLFGGDSSSLR